MISSDNAKQYSVGSLLGTPTVDDDHLRGRLAVHDASTVAAMEAGKTQVSLGYVCDTLEKPGVHPVYGPYDAIQKNIRGDRGGHVAIVDRARAGVSAAARMDGWMVVPGDGTPIALMQDSCQHVVAMADLPTARVELVLRTDNKIQDQRTGAPAEVDPGDLAHRNAEGKTAAKPDPKRQPGQTAQVDRGGDVVRGAQPAVGAVPVDGEGQPEDYPSKRLQDGDDKVAASTWAVPGKKQLPIHSPDAVTDSMKQFAKTEFDSPDAKHAAFNRIAGKGKQFGMDCSKFIAKHGDKLDRADAPHEDDMPITEDELKALREKADKADERKNKLAAAKARIDSLVADVAAEQAKVHDLTKQLEASKTTRNDGADVEKLVAERADAKLALLDEARATGAAVDSKMSIADIKRAVVKHVDSEDVAADAHEKFLDGVYHGALKRAKKDAKDTTAGANALGAARATVQAAAAGAQRADANVADEAAAKAALARANREAIYTPSLAKTRNAR